MHCTFPRIPAIVGTALIALPAATVVRAPEVRDDDSRLSTTLDNSGDGNFNQLLGINDASVIIGYCADGAVVAEQNLPGSRPCRNDRLLAHGEEPPVGSH